LKYMLREVNWRFDDSEYCESGYLGIKGVYGTREEAEEAKKRLEREAYSNWLPWLLRLEAEIGGRGTYDPKDVYRFYVERLGAETTLLHAEPYTLPGVGNLPWEPTDRDLDDLRKIIGTEFVHIIEVSNSVSILFQVSVHPVYRDGDHDWVLRDAEWGVFSDRREGILFLYRRQFFEYSDEIRIQGSLHGLSPTPNILKDLINKENGLFFKDDVLTLTYEMSDDLIVTVNSLLKTPPVQVEEISF
jgi:hypothetical protein